MGKKKAVTVTEESDNHPLQTLALVERLGKSLKREAKQVSRNEARFLVDAYYTIQDYRKSLENQLRAHAQRTDEAPATILSWIEGNVSNLETGIKNAMKAYAEGHPVGRWSMSIKGIGPVIAAGLLAHIDMDEAKTPGHIYTFAGMNPCIEWIGSEKTKKVLKEFGYSSSSEKKVSEEDAKKVCAKASEVSGVRSDRLMKWAVNESGDITQKGLYQAIARRPYNAKLKVLLWKIAKSFIKMRGIKSQKCSLYCDLYDERKAEEIERNEKGEFKEQAAKMLERVPNHAQKAIYKEGKLPPSHIESRVCRWLSKLFVSHWWELAYETHYKKAAPEPYPQAILGHAHKIERPKLGDECVEL